MVQSCVTVKFKNPIKYELKKSKMKRLENEELEKIRNEAEDLDIMDPLAVGKALSPAEITLEYDVGDGCWRRNLLVTTITC